VPKSLDTDPKQGFVALPASLFDIDLTPGAFRTLAELCRMANREGQCWPSLKQLGERLGRSKAAISGYIAELRETNLLETETQTMANGYNYRLRYTVTFWKSWRSQLGQSPERSVKPVERPLRTKNQSHKNNTSLVCNFEKLNLVKSWSKSVAAMAYPDFEAFPSEALIKATHDRLSLAKTTTISMDIALAFQQFMKEKGISLDSDDALSALCYLKKIPLTPLQTTSLMGKLADLWQPHWSKAPTPFQLSKLISSLPPDNSPEAEEKLLRSYLRRWDIFMQRLPSGAAKPRVEA